MRFDYSRLKKRIKEMYVLYSNFACKAKTNKCRVSHVLHGRSNLTSEEILIWSKVLKISKRDLFDYFFCVEGR